MKSREEKRRKFNEAVVSMLYPPPQPKNEDLVLSNNESEEDIENSEPIPGDLETNPSTDSDEDCEAEPPKLTRAQRKRIRRKKLAVDSRRRSQIVGPLLPPTQEEVSTSSSPTVRRNAAEELQEPSNSGKKSRVKQRRQAKKLFGRERQNVNLNSSNAEN